MDDFNDDDDGMDKSSHGRLRKRKANQNFVIKEEDSDDDDIEGKGDHKMPRTSDENNKEKFARENHSEIERRRRNKMNAYINELSDMVPSCNGLARKPDKLTVLRMAVNYMKSLRGSGQTPDVSHKPSFLSDKELKHLILEAADGFLFVVNCRTGIVVYVSDSITPVLNQPQSAWMNQEIYDLVHPDDAEKIRDQLSATESPDAGRVLDLKTGSVKKDSHGGKTLSRMYSNSRRNFICRMRCGQEEGETTTRGKDNRLKLLDDEYAIVHCTGYIKSFGNNSAVGGPGGDTDHSEASCLVTIGKLQPTSVPQASDLVSYPPVTEFVSRHSLDGKFTFVDQRVTEVLGYKPQDLLNELCYDFFHPDDLEHMMESYQQVMKLKGQTLSVRYRFRAKDGNWVWLRTSCHSFQNPYTDEAEYIVCSNCMVPSNNSMQPVTLNLSSPTINSSRSGPLTGSTDYSDISPHPDLTNPDSTAASLYQRHPQLMAGREDGMCHFSPTGAVQKVSPRIGEAGLEALSKASELSDKRGNTSPNTSVTQVPQKPDPTLVSPVPPGSGTATQRLGTGMLQHSMDQNIDLDNQEFSAGQAGSLLAALVQRRQAMINAAHSQSPQGGYSLMNGGMGSMLQAGMPGQQRPMGSMTPMDLLRAQMPRTMGEISSSGMMGYTTTITTRNGQTGGNASVVATQSMGGRDMMPGAWPHQGVMQRPVRDAEIKPPQTSTLPSQVESTAPPGMYSGMRPGTGPASGRGPAQGFPSYYQ
ncbi:aryl hydrocarbon receptor nuclear translocator 2-like isoform X2 [Porites lutea]|uniref:aryl hydrocarbon receptor nuclear translocator 2-like isoform X2 n=1 Tax=Porites lutea TaxID=51062 RepID=UPI003CC53DC4